MNKILKKSSSNFKDKNDTGLIIEVSNSSNGKKEKHWLSGETPFDEWQIFKTEKICVFTFIFPAGQLLTLKSIFQLGKLKKKRKANISGNKS